MREKTPVSACSREIIWITVKNWLLRGYYMFSGGIGVAGRNKWLSYSIIFGENKIRYSSLGNSYV